MAKIEFGIRSTGRIDWQEGMTTSAHTDDGGFSSESYNINPMVAPGLLYASQSPVNLSTNLTDTAIASCEDPNYLGNDRMFLDDTGAFYTLSGVTLTKKVTASSDLFTFGTTDFVAWANTAGGINYYATTKAGSGGDIVKWDGNVTLTETWWTGAGTLNQAALSATTAWRPLLVYEQYLFVGDANKLHRIAKDLTVSNAIITLPATENISALGIDRGTGKMLIATTTGVDYSASRNGNSKLYIYDGFSDKPLREIPIAGTVTAITHVGDQTYIFYGNKMGMFTGNGIQYLRTLSFSTGNGANLVYKHKTTRIENTLYFGDLDKIMAYGESRPGKKVFYYPVANPLNSNTISIVTFIGGSKLAFSFASAKLYTCDLTATTSLAGMVLKSPKYYFPKMAQIQKIELELGTQLAANSILGTLYYIDENGTQTSLGDITDVVAFYNKEFKWQPKVKLFQLYLTTTGNFTNPIRRVIVTYDLINE